MARNYYEDAVTYAYLLTATTNKLYKQGNTMSYFAFLLGEGQFKVEGFPGSGQNCAAVVDGIHKFYAEEPNSAADKGFEEGLFTGLRLVDKVYPISLMCEYIENQIIKEANKKAAFMLDCKSLVKSLEECIQRNYEVLQTESENMDRWILELKTFFHKYGYSFM